jgi:cysteine desulfurase
VALVLADPSPATLPEPVPQPPDGYLDAVAGQPILPVALTAWRAASDQAWSDPARLHHPGRRTGMLLDAARAAIADCLDIRPAEVYFTSSGPTAVAAAVQGLLEGRSRVSVRAVVSAVESMAVLSPVERWATDVDIVGVDRAGRVDLEALARKLATPAAIACVQAANAEVGTRQPLEAVAALTRGAAVPLLVHAIQVIGREPVPPVWDVLAASARDWGGPAGVGILAVRPSARWLPEENPDRGWVGGFPDVPGAAAAATALEYLRSAGPSESRRLHLLADRIREALPRLADGIEVQGSPGDRLPHIVTFTCSGVTGEVLVHELDRRGISVASGSACTSDTRMPSQVLAAMGIAADSSIRVSLPLGCREASVDAFLAALPEAVASSRSGFGA